MVDHILEEHQNILYLLLHVSVHLDHPKGVYTEPA